MQSLVRFPFPFSLTFISNCDLLRSEKPKIQYEQYPTTAHLAARMIYTADTVYDDIEDKAVGDFGSGCGILSIASFIRGAGYVNTHIHRGCQSFSHDLGIVLALISILMRFG